MKSGYSLEQREFGSLDLQSIQVGDSIQKMICLCAVQIARVENNKLYRLCNDVNDENGLCECEDMFDVVKQVKCGRFEFILNEWKG